MQPIKALSETLSGMQNVEREIIRRIRERKVGIDSKNFSWNHGRELAGIPSLVHMEVRMESTEVMVDWPREWLADSWDRIDRWEVSREIERLVGELAPQP